jgi:hypothetical protein
VQRSVKTGGAGVTPALRGAREKIEFYLIISLRISGKTSVTVTASAKEKRELIDSIQFEARNSSSVKEIPSQLMARVTAQLEAVTDRVCSR